MVTFVNIWLFSSVLPPLKNRTENHLEQLYRGNIYGKYSYLSENATED